MVVIEIQCRGRCCDNMRLQCGRLGTGFRVDAGDIRRVDWFSEEEGERRCPDGYYLWGMARRGDFCDGIKLNCARVDWWPCKVACAIEFVACNGPCDFLVPELGGIWYAECNDIFIACLRVCNL